MDYFVLLNICTRLDCLLCMHINTHDMFAGTFLGIKSCC